jgi:hypothetical protein
VHDRIIDLLAQRSAAYATAALTVDAAGTRDECVERLMRAVEAQTFHG